LNVRLQTAWHGRRWDWERFERTRAEAFKAVGLAGGAAECLHCAIKVSKHE